MFFTLFRLSLRALLLNKARTFLTMLGIIVGTSTVIMVISIGEGAKGFILSQLSSFTPDLISVESRVPSKAKTNQTAGAVASGVQITTMKVEDVKDVAQLPNVLAASGYRLGQEKVVFENNQKKTYILGLQPAYFSIFRYEAISGRLFTEEEENNGAQVVVLGQELKKILFGDNEALGKNIKIKQVNFRVIGVMEKIGSQGFFNFDEVVFIPLQTGQQRIFGVNYIPEFVVQVVNTDLSASTIRGIERVLRDNHGIKDPAKDDFAITTSQEALNIVGAVTGGISLLLLSISVISLIVGGIGIMNVMYVTVTERIREIGLRKAIGASPRLILMQFLIEAVLITLLGGGIGIALGTGLSTLLSFAANFAGFQVNFAVPLNAIILSFGVSAAFGIIFGYAPARQASRLNPIESLRHE